MPEKQLKHLQEAFCHECFERMLRAKSVLEQSDLNIDAEDCFDQLHQEFDSMVGASRALHYPLLEKFSRYLASYSRLLRERLPVPASAADVELLHQSINLWMGCGGKMSHCLSKCDSAVEELIKQIDVMMKTELQ